MGKNGAGHFVKMVHNGIEYGMMQAIAEGFDIMRSSEDFDIDLQNVASVYNHGSVIESNLIDWMQSGFGEFSEDLESVSGTAHASGEGRWTMQYADNHNIPARVIADAVEARDDSKENPNYQAKIIQTLRNQFGGHKVNPDESNDKE
jgi:6-phosphogluconate dehydrogenase